MTKLTEDALKQEINTRIADNTAGEITAARVRNTLIDMVDSLEIRPDPGFQSPSITRFIMQNQPTEVNAGTTLSGVKTFLYNVSHPGNVSGNLTLQQGASVLRNDIPPVSGGSETATINSVTLNAGEDVIFQLSGTDTQAGNFFSNFTVRALTDDEYLYFGTQISSNAGDFVFSNEERQQLTTGNTQVILPTFSGSEFIVFSQPATSTDFSEIIVDSVNQIGAFIKNANAVIINSINFDVWISNRAQLSSRLSNEVVNLIR